MSKDKEHIIPFSRKKIFSTIRANLFFVVLFILVFWIATIKPTVRSSLLQILAIPLVLMFISLSILSTLKLNDKSPGLVINPQGIIENSSLFPVGLISWSDIVAIYVKQYRSSCWLMIEVKNPEHYFAQDNLLIHVFRRLNSFFGGSSLFLSAGFLAIDFDDMVDIVREYHKKYGSA